MLIFFVLLLSSCSIDNKDKIRYIKSIAADGSYTDYYYVDNLDWKSQMCFSVSKENNALELYIDRKSDILPLLSASNDTCAISIFA